MLTSCFLDRCFESGAASSALSLLFPWGRLSEMSPFRPGQEEVGLLIADAARPQQIPGTEKCFPLWQAVF